MKKINTKADFLLLTEFVKNNDPRNLSYKDCLKILPDRFQDMITKDNVIKPRNLSADLFRELFIESLQKINPEYIIDSVSEEVIKSISMYFTMDEGFLKDESLSFNKGILLMGRVGCGKTVLFKGLAILMGLFDYKDYYGQQNIRFTTLNSYSFTEGFAKKGFDIFDEGLFRNGNMVRFIHSRLLIDDIGAENISSHYGTVTNVIGEVFLRRYDSMALTFATTNLDPKGLKAFYGDRVYSRMVEMMNFLIYEGNDRRH